MNPKRKDPTIEKRVQGSYESVVSGKEKNSTPKESSWERFNDYLQRYDCLRRVIYVRSTPKLRGEGTREISSD